jgi:hypothetical protein
MADTNDKEERFTLDQEIALKYEPAQLSRLVMRDAGRGEPLDLSTRMEMERRLGGDFSNVRVFRGPLAEEITRRYRADAVTIGGTEMILVREGWRGGGMQSAEGKALLAHELTHVRQQQRGLHFALQSGGQHSDIEHEAERVEARVLAEEQGRDLQAEARRRQEERQRRLLQLVRQEVIKKLEERKKEKRERGGYFGQGWG